MLTVHKVRLRFIFVRALYLLALFVSKIFRKSAEKNNFPIKRKTSPKKKNDG